MLSWPRKVWLYVFPPLLAIACVDKNKQGDGVRSAEVKKGDIVQEVVVSGVLTPKRRLVVSPSYDGYIKTIFVKLGQMVRMGDPLVKIVSSPTGDEVGYPQRAQFTGRVVDVLRNEGEWVEKTKDNPILVIDDQSVYTVECLVPEVDIVKYKPGLTATITPLAIPDKKYSGKIVYVAEASKLRDANRWNANGIEFSVKVQVLNPDTLIRSGMSATVKVTLDAARDVATLPHEFVHFKDGKAEVQTVDGKVKEVTVGISDDRAIEVKSGLAVGEKVKQVDFYNEKM